VVAVTTHISIQMFGYMNVFKIKVETAALLYLYIPDCAITFTMCYLYVWVCVSNAGWAWAAINRFYAEKRNGDTIGGVLIRSIFGENPMSPKTSMLHRGLAAHASPPLLNQQPGALLLPFIRVPSRCAHLARGQGGIHYISLRRLNMP